MQEISIEELTKGKKVACLGSAMPCCAGHQNKSELHDLGSCHFTNASPLLETI